MKRGMGVPIVALITWIVRRAMKVRSQNRYLGWVFGGLWTLGWVCLAIFVASMASDFRFYKKTDQEIRLAQPALSKLLIRVDDPGHWISSGLSALPLGRVTSPY